MSAGSADCLAQSALAEHFLLGELGAAKAHCHHREEPPTTKHAYSGVQERVAAAKRWLEQQRERVVFLYGHSVFWRHFFQQSESMKNCEYRVIHW